MSGGVWPDMRCLFLVDEITRFRAVAAVLEARDIAMTMAKEAALAARLAELGRFDVVIVGANSISSESMHFLQRRRVRRCPVIAVTCQPDLQRALIDAGADRVVVLSEGGDKLSGALELIPRTKPRPESRERSRLWQRFGL